jgi:plastocyanin
MRDRHGSGIAKRRCARRFCAPHLRKTGLPQSAVLDIFASDYQLQNSPPMRSFVLAVCIALFASFAALADPGPVAITIRDHAFVPAEIKIPAGAKVELTIRNEQAVPAEFESASLHREKVVSPGSAISVYVGPLSPGRYEFFDDFHPATRGVVVVE